MRRTLCKGLLALVAAVSVVVVGALGGAAQDVRADAGNASVPCAVASDAANGAVASLSFVRGPSILLASADDSHVSTVLRGGDLGQDYWDRYGEPAWSRDGGCIAAWTVRTHGGVLQDYGVVVQRDQQEIEVNAPMADTPSWSPDGRRLVLVAYEDGDLSRPALLVLRVGANTYVWLTSQSEDDPSAGYHSPAWSPDGSRIAFTRTQYGAGLYLIRPDRTGQRRLTSTRAFNPSWSPNSKRLVFDDGHRVAVINTVQARVSPTEFA